MSYALKNDRLGTADEKIIELTHDLAASYPQRYVDALNAEIARLKELLSSGAGGATRHKHESHEIRRNARQLPNLQSATVIGRPNPEHDA